jgi:hypothetical protein
MTFLAPVMVFHWVETEDFAGAVLSEAGLNGEGGQVRQGGYRGNCERHRQERNAVSRFFAITFSFHHRVTQG